MRASLKLMVLAVHHWFVASPAPSFETRPKGEISISSYRNFFAGLARPMHPMDAKRLGTVVFRLIK
jgi:hypothetical protein